MIRSSNEYSADADRSQAVPWMPGAIGGASPDDGAPEREIATPEAEYERGCRDGFADGRAEGLAEGQRLEREALLPLRGTLEAVVADIGERQDAWLSNLDENLAALAVAIARQLIQREVGGDRDAVLDLVRGAVAKFPVGREVTIRLHPQDLTLLSDASADGSATGRPDTRWIADPLIEPGGCVVEGPDSVIDGRLDRALERVYRSLADE